MRTDPRALAALAALLASACHLPLKTTCRDDSDCNPRQVCVATVCVAEGDGGTEADARVTGSTAEPMMLVFEQGVTRFVVDDAAIYWTNGPMGTVSRKSLVTGELTVIVTGQPKPLGIAVDSERVYWTGGGVVRTAPLTGGTISTIAAGQIAPAGMAIDADRVYWASAPGPRVVSKSGGPPAPLVAGELGAGQLTVDDERVYWTGGQYAGTVWSADKNGAPPRLLASEQAMPDGIAVDADTVYWTARDDGRVMKTARDGGATPVVVADSLHSPGNIVIDANHVYVTVSGDRTILRLSKDGREKTIWATDWAVPAGLAIDATTVYWSTLDGHIMKMSK